MVLRKFRRAGGRPGARPDADGTLTGRTATPEPFEESGVVAAVTNRRIVPPMAFLCAGGLRTVTHAPTVATTLASWRDVRLSGNQALLVNPESPLFFRAGTGMWTGKLRNRRTASLLWAEDAHHDGDQGAVPRQSFTAPAAHAAHGAPADTAAKANAVVSEASVAGDGFGAPRVSRAGREIGDDQHAPRPRARWWRRANARRIRSADGVSRSAGTAASGPAAPGGWARAATAEAVLEGSPAAPPQVRRRVRATRGRGSAPTAGGGPGRSPQPAAPALPQAGLPAQAAVPSGVSAARDRSTIQNRSADDAGAASPVPSAPRASKGAGESRPAVLTRAFWAARVGPHRQPTDDDAGPVRNAQADRFSGEVFPQGERFHGQQNGARRRSAATRTEPVTGCAADGVPGSGASLTVDLDRPKNTVGARSERLEVSRAPELSSGRLEAAQSQVVAQPGTSAALAPASIGSREGSSAAPTPRAGGCAAHAAGPAGDPSRWGIACDGSGPDGGRAQQSSDCRHAATRPRAVPDVAQVGEGRHRGSGIAVPGAADALSGGTALSRDENTGGRPERAVALRTAAPYLWGADRRGDAVLTGARAREGLSSASAADRPDSGARPAPSGAIGPQVRPDRFPYSCPYPHPALTHVLQRRHPGTVPHREAADLLPADATGRTTAVDERASGLAPRRFRDPESGEANTNLRTPSRRAPDLAAGRAEAAVPAQAARAEISARTAGAGGSITRVRRRLTVAVRDGAGGAEANAALSVPTDEPTGSRPTLLSRAGTVQHERVWPASGRPTRVPPSPTASTPAVEDVFAQPFPLRPVEAEPACKEPVRARLTSCPEPASAVTRSLAPPPYGHPGVTAMDRRRTPGAVPGGEPARHTHRFTTVAAQAPSINLDGQSEGAQVPAPVGWYRASTGLPLDRGERRAATAAGRTGWLGPRPERLTKLRLAQDEEGATDVG